MAKFKILKSQNVKDGKFSGSARIEYELVSGKILPGDVFRLYVTHHYTNHQIIHTGNDFFYATPNLMYDGQSEGKVKCTNYLGGDF